LRTGNSQARRSVFYIFSGLREQARALVELAARQSGTPGPRIAIVYPENQTLIVDGAEEQCKKLGWNVIARIGYTQLDAEPLARSLSGAGVEALFFFGWGADTSALLKAAAEANWLPRVYLLGALSGKELLGLPRSFHNKLFLGYPAAQPDRTVAGAQEYMALVEKLKLPSGHGPAQLAAYAAMKIFVEGLVRAGRELSREKLVAALEGLYNFETGVTPPVSYGPNRRVGALGAYVVAVGLDKGELAPVAPWITPRD